MAERFSTQFIKQVGARRKTVDLDPEGTGILSNTFQDSKGFEQALNSALTTLTDKTLVSSSLNSQEYFIAKSFFEKRGASEPSAITLSVLALDAAKIQDISVMKLLEPLRNDNSLSFETIVAANIFRPNSSKQSYLVPKTKADSARGRDILP